MQDIGFQIDLIKYLFCCCCSRQSVMAESGVAGGEEPSALAGNYKKIIIELDYGHFTIPAGWMNVTQMVIRVETLV